MSCDITNCRPIRGREIILHKLIDKHRIDILSGPALRAAPAKNGSKQSINSEGGDVSVETSSQTNVGLLTFSSEGFGNSKFNDSLAALPFLTLFLAAIYCVWRAKRLVGLSNTLSYMGVGMAPVQAPPPLSSAHMALPAPRPVQAHAPSIVLQVRSSISATEQFGSLIIIMKQYDG